jgi:hypothetical protein
MQKQLLSIFVLFICLNQAFGQNSKYYFAKKVFKQEYRTQIFEKFNGKVEKIDEGVFRFGDKVLTIDAEDNSLLTIFSQGIFHPNIIGGTQTIKELTKAQLDTMSESARFFHNLSRNDTIIIGQVESLERLNPNLKTKRYLFWLYQRGMANPTECYFEIYNSRAAKNMTFEEFVKGSRLTFYHKGTIII